MWRLCLFVYLNHRHNIRGGGFKFVQIDVEMMQLVLLGPLQHDRGAIPHGVNAPEISGGVQRRVGRFGNGQFGDGGGQTTALVPGRAQGGVGGAGAVDGDKRLVFILVAGRPGIFAPEETHAGGGRERNQERGRRGVGSRSISWKFVLGKRIEQGWSSRIFGFFPRQFQAISVGVFTVILQCGRGRVEKVTRVKRRHRIEMN